MVMSIMIVIIILSAFHTHCYRNDLDVQQQQKIKQKTEKKEITWSEKNSQFNNQTMIKTKNKQ